MATAMDGWSRKEKLYILQGLNNLDFDKMETKIPTRTRQEIKNAVLHMVNGLADAPRAERVPISKLQHVVSITSNDPNKQRLKTQIVRLLPNFNYVPPTQCVMNIDVRELFEQIANAIEGKPVVADAAIMEIMHVIIEEVSELCGGYISPELNDFITRINSSAIPMPPSAARNEQQHSDPGDMHARAKTNIPPMYTTANTNIPPLYSPANTNIPSMYSQANTKIPPIYTTANINIPPMYVHNIQPATCEFEPTHATVTCQYEPVYAPANYNYNPIHAPPKMIYNPAYPPAMGNYNAIYAPPMYNLRTPGNANCVPSPCVCDTLCVNTQGLFEPSMVPAYPPRHELPSRPAGNGAYHAEPKGQYCHAMNKNGQ